MHEEGHTSKLQPKAWEGVLVGYDDDSPTFRIYNRTTQQVLSSRNVTFIEPVLVLPPSVTTENDEEDIDISDLQTIAEGITSLDAVKDNGTSGTNILGDGSSALPPSPDPRYSEPLGSTRRLRR